MSLKNFAARIAMICACLFGASAAVAAGFAAAEAPPGLENAKCLECHEASKDKISIKDPKGKDRQLRGFDTDNFGKGVHSKLACVSCHADIVDAKENHEKAAGVARAECASCHERLWSEAQKSGEDKTKPRLGVVVENILAYRDSFHATADRDDPSRPKAACSQCHATHEFAVPPQGTPERNQWRLTVPQTCSGECHEEQLEDYETSTHGQLVLGKGDPKAAVCSDCHTSHEVRGSSSDPFKLQNVEDCGGCHQAELYSYRDTYHGQVHKLGYTYTAKCSDCHGSHAILGPSDPDSKVHVDNRLKTCQQCHNDRKEGMTTATAGFVTFGPHAHGSDFAKYPQMWVATKLMVALLIGVFLFFWLHCIFWYYREWQERKHGKHETHVQLAALGLPVHKHVVRFAWGWRIAHLIFAVATMVLVLTGMTVLFASSWWSPAVADFFGGPRVLGLIHRVAAAVFFGIFLIHFAYVMVKLLRKKDFRWFGPDSMVPNWKDLDDCVGMFKWFFGMGPKPKFERWTYFEKFDYWAVFWGVNVIGWSGLMLAFPHVTATYLPGWVLNVATLVHAEEAFLAAVFLFTVHFFNNHFRPDKLPPPDVVMFTGTQSLEEFSREHTAYYERLVASGELDKYLVEAPPRPLHAGSVILGLVLIAAGLILLVLVISGFLS